MKKRIFTLCALLFITLSLAACKGQTDEQNSAQPTPTATPIPTPTPPIPFTDVSEDSPYYDAVVWAYQNGIASDGETFGPSDTCTRGQVLTFLWRAMGSPEPWIMEDPFDGASPDDWYYKPALWAYQHNIATSTTVNPDNPCTNAEALTFLWRAEGKPDMLNTLAASGTYYGQPVAWAEKNGLFTGAEFDPAAPCSRADLMAYLYWAVKQWVPSEEEQKIQTEYDKILYRSENRPYYADYVDVDGDGRAELLTLERRNEGVAIAVYTDVDGHVEKSCEGIFREVEYNNTPVDTFLTDGGVFSLYSADGQLYLCQNRYFHVIGTYPEDDDLYDFYKIEKGAVTFCEQRSIWTLYDRETGEEQKGDTGTSRNYTKLKDIFSLSHQYPNYSASVLDEGILPSKEECERFWTAYWEASDPMYTAALNGVFSAFAGTYTDGAEVRITMDKDGVLTNEDATDSWEKVENHEPISVNVLEDGVIYCVVQRVEEENGSDADIWRSSHRFYIYPAGMSATDPNDSEYRDNLDAVRIEYWWPSQGVDVAIFTRIPDYKAIYAAVQNGDFSAFAGNYKSGWSEDATLDVDGVLTISIGEIKPITVTVTEEGVILCLGLEDTMTIDDTTIHTQDRYEIWPVGVGPNRNNVVRIEYSDGWAYGEWYLDPSEY